MQSLDATYTYRIIELNGVCRFVIESIDGDDVILVAVGNDEPSSSEAEQKAIEYHASFLVE